jgi:hypothetical protein
MKTKRPAPKPPTAADLRGRIAVSPTEAAILLSISRAAFYERVMPAVHTGAIASLRIGASRRILVSALLAWAEAKAAQE